MLIFHAAICAGASQISLDGRRKLEICVVLSHKRSGMEFNMTGMFAFSRAGHDKGRMYLIIGEDEEYVYLADGRLRTVDKPKKKKKKHIQPVRSGTDEALAAKLRNAQTIYNEEIKFAIKVRTNKEVADVKS